MKNKYTISQSNNHTRENGAHDCQQKARVRYATGESMVQQFLTNCQVYGTHITKLRIINLKLYYHWIHRSCNLNKINIFSLPILFLLSATLPYPKTTEKPNLDSNCSTLFTSLCHLWSTKKISIQMCHEQLTVSILKNLSSVIIEFI